jgi:hypothetical protein
MVIDFNTVKSITIVETKSVPFHEDLGRRPALPADISPDRVLFSSARRKSDTEML